MNFKFGGGVRFTLETSDFCVKLLIRIGCLLQQDAIQVARVSGKFEVGSLDQGLVIEVRAHVVGDGYDKGSKVGGVTLKIVCVFKQFKLDKISVHAKEEKEDLFQKKAADIHKSY